MGRRFDTRSSLPLSGDDGTVIEGDILIDIHYTLGVSICTSSLQLAGAIVCKPDRNENNSRYQAGARQLGGLWSS